VAIWIKAMGVYAGWPWTTMSNNRKMAQAVMQFNGTIRRLLAALLRLYPHDEQVVRTKKRVSLVVEEFPVLVVQIVGQHLFRFKDQLLAGDRRFFLENDYSEELREGGGDEKAQVVAYLIPKIKQAWRDSSEEDREVYFAEVMVLFDSYIDFTAAQALD
jgi:hypothetical protein